MRNTLLLSPWNIVSLIYYMLDSIIQDFSFETSEIDDQTDQTPPTLILIFCSFILIHSRIILARIRQMKNRSRIIPSVFNAIVELSSCSLLHFLDQKL